MDYKKILMLVAIVIMSGAAMGVKAENVDYETKHEFGISYGALSNSQWIDVMEDVIAAPFNDKHVKYGDESFFGPISAEYFYRINSLVGVGAVAVFGTKKQDITVDDLPEGEMKNQYFTFMPAAKIDWLRRNNFGMYSKVAAGVTFRSEKNDHIDYSESNCHFNWQASLIGVEAGSTTVRGFAELGFGEQGIVLAGVRCKF